MRRTLLNVSILRAHILRNKISTVFMLALLACGVSCVTITSSLYTSMSRPRYQFSEADKLVTLSWSSLQQPSQQFAQTIYSFPSNPSEQNGSIVKGYSFSAQQFRAFKDQRNLFSEVFAFAPIGKAWYGENWSSIELDGKAEALAADLVSGNFFSGLRLVPKAGRFISNLDEQRDEPVAVISYLFCLRHFIDAEDSIGHRIKIQGLNYTVIGVAPKDFDGLVDGVNTQVWIPFSENPALSYWGGPVAQINDSKTFGLLLMARVASGRSFVSANVEAASVFRTTMESGIAGHVPPEETPQLVLKPGANGVPLLRAALTSSLTVLWVAANAILLVICVNLATLMLEKAKVRRKELAIQTALGASRARIISETIAEALAIFACGGVVGIGSAIVFGSPLNRWLGATVSLQGLIMPTYHVNVKAALYSLVCVLTLGGCLGLIVALKAIGRESHISETLKSHSEQTGVFVLNRFLAGKLIVITQVAISSACLMAAGTFMRTAIRLNNHDYGFEANRLIVLTLHEPVIGTLASKGSETLLNLQQSLARIPGVTTVTSSLLIPLSGHGAMSTVSSQGAHATSEASMGQMIGANHNMAGMSNNDQIAHINLVGPNFLHTLRVPILLGRDTSWKDVNDAPQIVIISKELSRQLFGNDNPLGRLITVAPAPRPYLVVGVNDNFDYESIYESFLKRPLPAMFIPYTQWPLKGFTNINFEVRTDGEASTMISLIRKEVGLQYPAYPTLSIDPQTEIINRGIARERLLARIAEGLSILCMVITAAGLSGVLLFMVEQRKFEIALRIALGSSRISACLVILRQAILITLVGSTIGIPLGVWISQLMTVEYEGINTRDPAILGLALLSMLGLTIFACIAPLKHILAVEPSHVLRSN
jgi:predicted permease